MQKFINPQNISLPMAVWLANDTYDYDSRTNVISVTTLMKSVKQIVLGSRIKPSDNPIDIATLLPSRLGTAVHNAIEEAWVSNKYILGETVSNSFGDQGEFVGYSENKIVVNTEHGYRDFEQDELNPPTMGITTALTALGYPQTVLDRIKVNPNSGTLNKLDLPVYLEQRAERQVGKWIVSGKFDLIFNGMIQDIKSTGTFTFTKKTNDLKYILQLSLYRWLNPLKVTKDHGAIQFIFKDWNKNLAFNNVNYPRLPVLEYLLQLTPISEIDQYVVDKLNALDTHWEVAQEELPMCTDADVWRGASTFKYYGKADAKRATKVFDDPFAAQNYFAEKGKGIVREVKSSPIGCLYCPAFNTCKQGQGYIEDGSLVR